MIKSNASGSLRRLVSVIVPVRNAETYLPRSLTQLATLDRSACDYEFIVIDDHSTDSTWSMLQDWPAALEKVVVTAAAETGVASARNQALSLATGEFVWFADADDDWDPRIVTLMLAAALETSADLVVSNAVKQTPDGADVGSINDATTAETSDGPEAFTRLLEGRVQGHLWNKLFRTSTLPSAPFPATRAHSDLGGIIRTLPVVGRVSYLPVTLYTYLQNPGSILNSSSYDYRDLLSCLDLVDAIVDTNLTDPRRRAGYLIFKYRTVLVTITNELARRKDRLGEVERKAALAAVRGRVNLLEVLSLLAHSPSLTTTLTAAQASVIRTIPRGYERAYIAARLRHTVAVEK